MILIGKIYVWLHTLKIYDDEFGTPQMQWTYFKYDKRHIFQQPGCLKMGMWAYK
jgi:hypothetical protein